MTSQSGSRTNHARDSNHCLSVQPSVEQRNRCSARHCHLQCFKSSEALFCCACVYMLHTCNYSVCLSVHPSGCLFVCMCSKAYNYVCLVNVLTTARPNRTLDNYTDGLLTSLTMHTLSWQLCCRLSSTTSRFKKLFYNHLRLPSMMHKRQASVHCTVIIIHIYSTYMYTVTVYIIYIWCTYTELDCFCAIPTMSVTTVLCTCTFKFFTLGLQLFLLSHVLTEFLLEPTGSLLYLLYPSPLNLQFCSCKIQLFL